MCLLIGLSKVKLTSSYKIQLSLQPMITSKVTYTLVMKTLRMITLLRYLVVTSLMTYKDTIKKRCKGNPFTPFFYGFLTSI